MTTTKAIIYTQGDKGSMYTVVKTLRGLIRSKGYSAKVKSDEESGEVRIIGDVDSSDIDKFVKHNQDHIERYENLDAPKETKLMAVETRHDDYIELRNKARKLSEKLSKVTEEKQALETSFFGLRSKFQNLQNDYDVLVAQNEYVGFEDFVTNVMCQENKVWVAFSDFYETQMKTVVDEFKIPRSLLEKCLFEGYDPSKDRSSEFDEEQYVQAMQAKDLADKNPFISLDPKAKSIIDRVSELNDQADIVRMVKTELTDYAQDKIVRLVLTKNNDVTLLTPFPSAPEEAGVEADMLHHIEHYLESQKFSFETKSSSNMVSYVVPDMKTRARNKFITRLTNLEGKFTQLGGHLQLVEIGVHAPSQDPSFDFVRP